MNRFVVLSSLHNKPEDCVYDTQTGLELSSIKWEAFDSGACVAGTIERFGEAFGATRPPDGDRDEYIRHLLAMGKY